ncbi:MAG: glutamine-hydrolyzing carbamoyl-phosphate synthase small subunit [Thermoproteota archaeon]
MESPLNFEKDRKAVLTLEDGSKFLGRGFGATKKVSGEVVFSTSMVGYPEALTDPSYKGQILTLTYPLIGNYGVPPYEQNNGIPLYFESDSIQVTGLVIHELCRRPHHWASTKTLDQWLKDEDIPGIWGIDTRRLTKKLRSKGVMLGILKVCEEGEQPRIPQLLKESEDISDPNRTDLVGKVTINQPVHHRVGGDKRFVLIDCGVKYSILRNLLNRGIDVIRVPYDFSSQEILQFHPDGVMVSNGPGDPKKCMITVSSVRDLVKEGIPLMGVCLGAQILALALGGDTYKMKYGHRSQNQPVVDLENSKCYLTTQNHGYSVDPDSIQDTNLEIWFRNANDQSVEGVKHKDQPVFALQWHPEASPGPYDTQFLFDKFSKLTEK